MGAIEYAEDHLEVHKICEATVEARGKLDAALTVLANARDRKRFLEEQLGDYEMNILIEERGKHADMSQAAMDKHVKQVLHKDGGWGEIRTNLRNTLDEIDGADMDRKLYERDIEIGCARMNELAGYFQFLAAVRNARPAREASKTSEASEAE